MRDTLLIYYKYARDTFSQMYIRLLMVTTSEE